VVGPFSNPPRRRLLADGTIEEESAAMGRSWIVPGSPSPGGIDLRAEAPGWERLRALVRRLGGG
jgi:hypothetical protein